MVLSYRQVFSPVRRSSDNDASQTGGVLSTMSTDGIDIDQWMLNIPWGSDGHTETVTLSTWDFAGTLPKNKPLVVDNLCFNLN